MSEEKIFGNLTSSEIEDYAKWEYNSFFLDTIIPALDYMIKEGHGYPGKIGKEKWIEILQEMKEGFELLRKNADRDGGWSFLQEFNNEDKEKIDRSFMLFKEHFPLLWD